METTVPTPAAFKPPVKTDVAKTDVKDTEKIADTTEQKYLGMSTSIGLPILIAGILVLGVGTIFAIKYFRKGKVA